MSGVTSFPGYNKFGKTMRDSIWNNNPEKFVKECKRLRALCQRIISSEESVIEGSQKMLQFRFWMKEGENPDWGIFAVVDSDSDHLPIGSVREHWAKDALNKKDEEIEELERFYREDVLKAVRLIWNQYKTHVEQTI